MSLPSSMRIEGFGSPWDGFGVQARAGRPCADSEDCSPTTAAKKPGGKPLSQDEEREVKELQRRDTEVRAHEAAHAAGAGAHGGGPSFTYTTGPDGKRYATGGEVPIRIAEGRTPEESIRNAQQVRAAALAPANPSGQDRAVAADATRMEAEARQELAEKARAQSDALARKEDPTEVLAKLEQEQRTTRGGWRHLHSDGGCGTCSRTAALYR